MIDIKNSHDFYDFRSKEILEILPPDTTINFVHINNMTYSLRTLGHKSNLIYFEAIYYALKPFLRNRSFHVKQTDNAFANQILEIHQHYFNESYHIYHISKWIMKFLNIQCLLSLDDSRYSNELNIAAKDLQITTIGYQHGRFNEYHIGLFEFPFDVYCVWSEYFKNKLLKLSSKYTPNQIAVIGHFRIKEPLSLIQREKIILWLGESNINYEEVTPFIEKAVKDGYNIIFRGKPGNNYSLANFLTAYNISIDTYGNYFESLKMHRIGVVIGTHSTALMESWTAGVPSFALQTSYDYGKHLWEDGLIHVCEHIDDVTHTIDNHLNMDNDGIIDIRHKIWGDKLCFDKEEIHTILLEHGCCIK